jgi:hypothetical protein
MHDKTAAKGPYDPTANLRGMAEKPGAESSVLLPALTDPYKAAGFADGEVGRLVVVMGKDGFRIGEHAYIAFQYVHMGIGQFGFTANAQVFSFVFSDIQPKLVTVQGRNLLRIFDCIGLRRVPWIRQTDTDRDFRMVDGGADNEPVITRLEVTDWVRSEEQAEELARAFAGT